MDGWVGEGLSCCNAGWIWKPAPWRSWWNGIMEFDFSLSKSPIPRREISGLVDPCLFRLPEHHQTAGPHVAGSSRSRADKKRKFSFLLPFQGSVPRLTMRGGRPAGGRCVRDAACAPGRQHRHWLGHRHWPEAADFRHDQAVARCRAQCSDWTA
jgi:hypothetical protein